MKVKSVLLLWRKRVVNCREGQFYSGAYGKLWALYKLQRKWLFGEIFLAPRSSICVDTTLY